MIDVMDQAWCCLTCWAKFAFGKLRTKPGSPNVHCPTCGSANVHPADKTTHTVTAAPAGKGETDG